MAADKALEWTMGYEDILFERQAHVATIAFNRPERLNALTPGMLAGALRAVAEVKADPDLRVLVITGVGRAFCAGADVKRMKASRDVVDSPSTSYEEIQRAAQELILTLSRLPLPVVGAINGVAAGAGFAIALACDLRIAARTARFKEAAMGIGLVSGDGSAWFLPRLVGLGLAFEIMLLEEVIDAERARCVGLVNRVVPDAELPAAANEIARQLAAKPPIALALTKQSILAGLRLELDQLNEQLLGMVETTRRTQDHLEGVRAFAQHRPPEFAGH